VQIDRSDCQRPIDAGEPASSRRTLSCRKRIGSTANARLSAQAIRSTQRGKTMSALNVQQITEFKARLRERATQLRGEIKQTLEKSEQESHVRIAEQARDLEDDSFSNLIVDVNLAEVDRDAAELRRIDGAMHRLLDGRYGFCEDCDKKIPVARLLAEPTASRCIECQERFEQTHATGATPRL
jgi:DnaK suppressor protein